MLFSKSFSSHYVLCYSCCADFSSILLKVLGRVVVCRVCCVYVPGGGMSRGKRQNLCGACAFGRCLSGNPVECSQLGYCSNILRTARPPPPSLPSLPKINTWQLFRGAGRSSWRAIFQVPAQFLPRVQRLSKAPSLFFLPLPMGAKLH